MPKLNLGLIGLGYIGKSHFKNALRLANADLVAVADVSKRALRTAKKSGVKKTYTDYEQLLKDPNVDAVIIALPTHLHLDCAIKAAEAKKHILLEKPIAKSVKEAKEIISASEKNGVKLLMGYPLRFTGIMSDLRNRLSTGEFGDIVTAYATNISTGPFMHRDIGHAPVPVPNWWFNKELTGGGALLDLGSHMINLMRWYFGEFKDIKCQLGYRFNLDVEDQAICIGRFNSGTVAIINVGYYLQKYQLKVEVVGTNDFAVADNTPPNYIVSAIQMLTTKTTSFLHPYTAELQHFVNCVTKDLKPISTGTDGLRDLEAIKTAYTNSIRLN